MKRTLRVAVIAALLAFGLSGVVAPAQAQGPNLDPAKVAQICAMTADWGPDWALFRSLLGCVTANVPASSVPATVPGSSPFSSVPANGPTVPDPSGWAQDDKVDFTPYGGKNTQNFLNHQGDLARVTLTWDNIVLPPWTELGNCSLRVTSSPQGEWIQSNGASRTYHWLGGGTPPASAIYALVNFQLPKLENQKFLNPATGLLEETYCGHIGAYTVSWQNSALKPASASGRP